ncbi:MAG: phosphatidate cytidylyltransferase [Planctomycetes bacterium]|nr:phosphatidate cytidylyltransferase [Planctomycetota bacterium]
MLKKRLIPASILIILISGLFYLDHYFKTTLGFTILLCLVAIGGLYEFYKMYENIGIKLPKVFPILIIVAWLLPTEFIKLSIGCNIPGYYTMAFCTLSWAGWIFIFLLASTIYYLFRISDFPHIFILIIGMIYVSFPIEYSAKLYGYNQWLIIYVIVIIKIADSLAYFGGIKFGRHKLAPSISPNKTVEGFIIGLLGGTIIGGFILFDFIQQESYLFSSNYVGFIFSVSASFTIIFFAQMGDLLESAFKRHCQVKDSGKLLGGLGGVLDLVDSLFLGIPIAYLLFNI